MEEFLKEFKDLIDKSRNGIQDELKDLESQFHKTVLKHPDVIVRQNISRTEEEARSNDIFTPEGYENTRKLVEKEKRVISWLTLSGKPIR